MGATAEPWAAFLEAVGGYEQVVLASHVNPDPDALASMLGLRALIEHKAPHPRVVMTLDGIIARAENQAMVSHLQIPLRPIEEIAFSPGNALVVVDTQPRMGRRRDEAVLPVAVLDHHDTPGCLDGVAFVDIRPGYGATATIVVEYLRAANLPLDARLATALCYGIESELSGYPREAGPGDDAALGWLYPRVDRDLLASIRNPKLPQNYFATFQHALWNAFLYNDVIISYCGLVPQPDIIAELADFFIRFDQVAWAICLGIFEGQLRLSVRADRIDAASGDVLRDVVDGLGVAGGHDRRAGGAIRIVDDSPQAIDRLLRTLGRRFLQRVGGDERNGRRLLEASPVHPVP